MGAFDQRHKAHASAARGLTKNCDLPGITAEGGDVPMHPFECHHLIQKPQVLRIRVILAVRQVGQMEKAENIHPVLDGDEDDIGILPDEISALLARLCCAADFKSTSVNPYHDRLLLCVRVNCLPYVQVQAILILRVERTELADIPLLAGTFGKIVCLVYTVIRDNIHRSLPTKVSYRLFPDKGDALEGDDLLVRLFADKGAIDALDSQRLVVIAIGDPSVLTVQPAHSLCCFFQTHIV